MTYDPRAIYQGLDEACRTCSRPCGDHTLREWAACSTEAGHHDPFRELEPGEPIPAKALEVVFDGEPLVIADVLDYVAAAADVDSTVVGPLPLVIFDFRSSTIDPKPGRVSRIGFMSTAEGMRAAGRSLRDACNAAANKAEARGGRR